MKHLLNIAVFLFTLAVIGSVGAFFWGAQQFTKPGPLPDPALFMVERGDHLNKIAGNLYAGNIIEDPFIFMIGVTLSGNQSKLKAGEYEIPAAASQKDIMQLMREGKTFARRITLREGLTSFEIVRELKAHEELSGDITSVPREGTLLPETYDYRLNEPRRGVLQRMSEAMSNLRQSLSNTATPENQSNLSLPVFELCKIKQEEGQELPSLQSLLDNDKCWHKIITLASIVEKETGKPDERRAVAGVFYNRLTKNMPLQTDPTVIYAITKGEHKNDGKGPLGRRLLSKDMEVDSPYNTYKYPGLPPGPIANPGRASIEAVLNPESNDYIYFVADGTGGHVFAKTLAEHNRNVAEWRKIRLNRERK